MKNIYFKACTALFFMLFATVTTAEYNDQLKKEINQIINHHAPNSNIGIFIADAKTGKEIYKKNSMQYFMPASNAKIFTAVAALYILGPNYRFKTTISTKYNNIYIQFTGDPSLTTQDFKKLITGLKNHNITNISGNIIIDNNRFEPPYHAPGWVLDDAKWGFAAPITAEIIDHNNLPIALITTNKLYAKPIILTKNKEAKKNITNNVIQVTEQNANTHCSFIVDATEQNKFFLHGCFPLSDRANNFTVAYQNPLLHVKEIILSEMQKNNIHFTGKIITGPAPKHAQVLVFCESRPLMHLINTMLKTSDNIYAESIIKTIGFKTSHHGSFKEGVSALKSALQHKTDINFANVFLYDGSGLSRYDLVTPEQLFRVLYIAYNDKAINTYFIKAMPLSGKSGTLKNRFQAYDLASNIRAKTGTMLGISALSGYITTKKNDYIFVIILNNFTQTAQYSKPIESEICAAIERFGNRPLA